MSNRKAFTLIELLVVISIIALLISILLPALNEARKQAKITVCATNLHQVVMGINEYAVENDGKLPPSPSKLSETNYHRPFELNYNHFNPNAVGPVLLRNYAGRYLGRYLPEAGVFNCPLTRVDPQSVWPPPMSGLAPEGTYQQYYLDGGYAPVHSTYQLLWSYQGYNFEISTVVNRSRHHFEGAVNMGSKTKLIVQDALFFLTVNTNILWQNNLLNSWYSSHPYDGSRYVEPYYTMTGSIPPFLAPPVPEVRLNAGYLDGHVEQFESFTALDVQQHSAIGFITENY